MENSTQYVCAVHPGAMELNRTSMAMAERRSAKELLMPVLQSQAVSKDKPSMRAGIPWSLAQPRTQVGPQGTQTKQEQAL